MKKGLLILSGIAIMASSCSEEEVYDHLNLDHDFGEVHDVMGNSYRTIRIGDQTWMADNLRTRRYRNGNPIPFLFGPADDNWTWSEIGLRTWFELDSALDIPHGQLYNWNAVSDERGLCPTGWRVPTLGDWEQLISYLEGPQVAGGKLKHAGPEYWTGPNGNASNQSGFSALGSGLRWHGGYFAHFKEVAKFWTTTASEDYPHERYAANLNSENGWVHMAPFPRSVGASVRCIKE